MISSISIEIITKTCAFVAGIKALCILNSDRNQQINMPIGYKEVNADQVVNLWEKQGKTK